MSSFVKDKIVTDGLTFDNILLIPAYYEVLPQVGRVVAHPHDISITSEAANYSRPE